MDRHPLHLRPVAVLPILLRHISLIAEVHSSRVAFLHSTNGMVFITNSTYQDFRAKVNGLGQVMSAFGRFVVFSFLSPFVLTSGPLRVLQRLRVVVQERPGLPVRLRVCVLCGPERKDR